MAGVTNALQCVSCYNDSHVAMPTFLMQYAALVSGPNQNQIHKKGILRKPLLAGTVNSSGNNVVKSDTHSTTATKSQPTEHHSGLHSHDLWLSQVTRCLILLVVPAGCLSICLVMRSLHQGPVHQTVWLDPICKLGTYCLFIQPTFMVGSNTMVLRCQHHRVSLLACWVTAELQQLLQNC
jgi:hypothetical protein